MKLESGGGGRERPGIQFWTHQASDIYQSSKKRERHRDCVSVLERKFLSISLDFFFSKKINFLFYSKAAYLYVNPHHGLSRYLK